MNDSEKLNKAIDLLKRWHFADWRFDLQDRTKDLRDFIEDDLDEDLQDEH